MIDAMRMRGCSDYTLKEIRWSVYLPIIRYRCDTGTGVCSDEHWKKYAEEYPRKTAYKRGVNLLYFSCHTADKRVRERYGTALQKIVKQNVSDAVYQQFLDAIMNGAWKPEERIPSETELATDLGVSRVTIRGALQRLEGLKRIERRQGEGTFVREMAGEQYADSLLPVAARTVAMKWGQSIAMLVFTSLAIMGTTQKLDPNDITASPRGLTVVAAVAADTYRQAMSKGCGTFYKNLAE